MDPKESVRKCSDYLTELVCQEFEPNEGETVDRVTNQSQKMSIYAFQTISCPFSLSLSLSFSLSLLFSICYSNLNLLFPSFSLLHTLSL